MSAGMAILVSSFERTVKSWIGHSLEADLYVYSAGARSASASNRIPAGTWRRLASHSGVAQALVLASYPVQLGAGAPAELGATPFGLMHRLADLPWIERPASDAVFDPARNADLAVVSETFSDRFHVGPGDALELPTATGPHRVRIAGVYADYGNERGTILVPWHSLVAWMGSDAATHVSLFLKPGVNPAALEAILGKEFPGLRVLTRSRLRTLVLQVFRQTFTITYALEAIGVAVAVAGLALAMASVLLDRRDELTALRAIGFSARQLAGAASCEGLALAAWAAAGGLALSFALGWLLIHVINKQSFGWTLQFNLPAGQLALLAAAVALTGAGVSYAVGRWGADLPADREA
jgi:putative ABC transport system permease protein